MAHHRHPEMCMSTQARLCMQPDSRRAPLLKRLPLRTAACLTMDKTAFLQPDETAAQMLARCANSPLHTGVPFIDGHARLRAKHVAVLSGASGSAKSRALVQVPPGSDTISCFLTHMCMLT